MQDQKIVRECIHNGDYRGFERLARMVSEESKEVSEGTRPHGPQALYSLHLEPGRQNQLEKY